MKRETIYNLLVSWENINLLMEQMITNPTAIDSLIKIGLYDTEKESWRAVWIVDKIHEKRPELIRPYIPQLIDSLQTVTNESKIRHLLKLISLNPLPDKKLSFLLNYSLDIFTNAARPIAIRVHAMLILFEISEYESGFKSELIQLIEHEIEFHPSAGLKSRGTKLLRKLHPFAQKN